MAELPDTEYVLAACNALEAAGEMPLLPAKVQRLALQLRSALLVERSHTLMLTHVIIQLIDSESRYADPDLVHAMRQRLAAWYAEEPINIGRGAPQAWKD